MPEQPRAIVWVDPDQEHLIDDVVAAADLDLVAIGSPTPAIATALAAARNTEHAGDLRQAIQRDDIDLIWLAAPMPLQPDERRAIRERRLPTFSGEPRPRDFDERQNDADQPSPFTFVPLMRRSPGFRAARDALDAFGVPSCVSVTMGCAAGEGSLFARLFDAIDLLAALCGEAERIDATLPGALAAPEHLAEMRGLLTGHVRYAERRAATIQISSEATWLRRVTLLGPGGALTISDEDYNWASGPGEVERSTSIAPCTPGSLIGEQIARRFDRREPDPTSPPPPATLLAVCEAARLSCRTGESEEPHRLAEILRRP